MNKLERAERLKEMILELSDEHTCGGFNEFSQWSEEILIELLPMLPEEVQKWLMKEVEETSELGITRRSPTIKNM